MLFSFQAQAVVYGTDTRVEAFNYPQYSDLRRATALMASPVYITSTEKDFTFNFAQLKDDLSHQLCPEHMFANQNSAYVNCTGVLVAPDKILTAGHCMVNFGEAQDKVTAFCKGFDWYFDYEYQLGKNIELKNISINKKYSCKKVIYAAHSYAQPDKDGFVATAKDYALIQLDRPVLDRSPVNLAPSAPEVILPQKIFSFGFPLGIPMKYASSTLDKDLGSAWSSQLDVWGGQSGSPVFNLQKELVGLVVRSFPEPDLVYNKARKCQIANSCGSTGCLKNATPQYPIQSEIQKLPAFLNAALRQ